MDKTYQMFVETLKEWRRNMSDKERLEMIKGIQKRIKECQEKGQNVSNLHSDYVDWLIEQAERVEELEKQNERLTMLLNDKSYERDRSTVIIAQLQMELDKYKKMYEKGA